MTNPQELIDEIKDRIEDPERREMLTQMGLDLAEAAAMQATDPEMAESLLRHLKAQALTLAATEAKVVSDAFMNFAMKSARTIVVAAIGAL